MPRSDVANDHIAESNTGRGNSPRRQVVDNKRLP